MEYKALNFEDAIKVNGIFSCFYIDFKTTVSGKGESHNFPELIFIKSGVHNLILNNENITLNPGQIMIYAPGHFHTMGDKGSDATSYILSFDTDSTELQKIYNRPITLNSMQKNIFLEFAETGIKYFTRKTVNGVSRMTLKKDISEYKILYFKKRLELFLSDISKTQQMNQREEKKHSIRTDEFEQIVKFMEDNISKKFTLEDFAFAGAMSVSKLKYLFRNFTGNGPVAYFNILKIEKAKKLICLNKYNFSEISDILGFNSVHYFSRLFKKVTGIPPTEYAKIQEKDYGQKGTSPFVTSQLTTDASEKIDVRSI